jgi:hypothetical protein
MSEQPTNPTNGRFVCTPENPMPRREKRRKRDRQQVLTFRKFSCKVPLTLGGQRKLVLTPKYPFAL